MSRDPAFLFYSSDFLIGTFGMSDAQVGQYIRLMCLQHQKGHLSERLIKSITGGVFDPGVMAKFEQDEEGLYFNVRLEEESKKRVKYAESRRQNRLKHNTSSTHDNHMSNICETHVEHMENVNEDVIVNGIDTVNSTLSGTNIPPKVSDVRAYCEARGNSIDPEGFVNYYETRGWMAGKAKMKNWQSAIRTWEKNAATMQPKTTDNVIWADQMREGEQA